MKSSRVLVGVVLLSLIARGQGDKKVSDADIKKLADPFAVMFPLAKEKAPDAKKQEAAKAEFMREYERIDKSVKPGALLAMPAVWTEVFAMHREVPKAPSGMGRAEERTVQGSYVGRPVEFHYAIILPNGFDPKKRYPLIVALHDKGTKDEKVTGMKYLDEVWMKLAKEERDKFIIIAPTMGPGAAGKGERVEWGDALHFFIFYSCLKEALNTLPIDLDRIYLEGAGDGGEFAWHVALYKPHTWAAVGIRSALPRVLQLLPNAASLPVSVHLRNGTTPQSGPNRAKFDAERKDLPTIEVKEYPAPDKPARSAFASDVVPEATAAIATFFGGKARNLGPKKVTYVTENPNADQAYWVRLVTFESGEKIGEKFSKISAAVDEAENTIDVKTEGVELFKLYLNDRVVNLDRPVKINLNGKPNTERQFTRSLDAFLAYYKGNRADPGLQPTAVIELKVPVVAPETKPESAPAPK